MSRFGTLDDDEIDILVDGKDSLATKNAIKQSVKLLRDFLQGKGMSIEFELLSVEDLCKVLCSFWANARRVDGTSYKKKTLQKVKFGLKRFMSERGIDIEDPVAFKKSSDVFKAISCDLKRRGYGNVDHKVPIGPKDMETLYNDPIVFNLDTPYGLLNKVWFCIMLNFVRRGRENQREMTKGTFAVRADDSGHEYVYQAVGELDKNHRGDDSDATPARMYAIAGKFISICDFLVNFCMIYTN